MAESWKLMFMDEQFHDQNTIITHVSQRWRWPSGLSAQPDPAGIGWCEFASVSVRCFFQFFLCSLWKKTMANNDKKHRNGH